MENNNLYFEIFTGTMLQTNNIVLGNKEHAIIVEASASLEKVINAVKNRKVEGIFLTHGHWDHYQNLQEIADHFGVKIYLTSEAYKKLFFIKERTTFMKLVPLNLKKEQFCFIEDNQVLDFGDFNIKVISTPGHTNCSVCFYVNYNIEPAKIDWKQNPIKLNGSVLLAGDTLFFGSQGRTDLPTGSQQQIEESIAKLMLLPEKLVVIPGHLRHTTIEKAKKHGF